MDVPDSIPREEMLALYELAAHVWGDDIGWRRAEPALEIVATALAERAGQFDWGEHTIERACKEMQCRYCGATFNPLQLGLECSAID